MLFRIKDIAHLLQGEIVGKEDAVVDGLGKIQEAKEGSLAFLANPKYENHIYGTKATAVLVRKDFIPSKPVTTTLIKVEDPYLAFSILLDEYYKVISFKKTGVEQPS
ncbi:MAG TPA: LpxD N-terminal domain-containing protein, partial [Cyclobacteriaceae bacterium]|nr:LpxD N-terminal domain-containing protein [Cyclobacteriaceae bacterium]